MTKKESNRIDIRLRKLNTNLETRATDLETRTTDLETRTTDLESAVEIKTITRDLTDQTFTLSKETTILHLEGNDTVYTSGSIKLELKEKNKIYNIVDFKNNSQDDFNNLWWNEEETQVVIQGFTYLNKDSQTLNNGTPKIIASPLIQLYTPDYKKIYILNIPIVRIIIP